MKRKAMYLLILGACITCLCGRAFAQLGARNITYDTSGGAIQIQYDIVGGWENEFNIVAITVSEGPGMPTYSITEHAVGKMGRLSPGKGQTLSWTPADNKILANQDLRFKIYISQAPTITQLATEKNVVVNPKVRSKISYIFLGTFAGSTALALTSLKKGNQLYDEYKSTYEQNRLEQLKDNITSKDRLFYIGVGSATVSIAFAYYFAFKYKGGRRIDRLSTPKTSFSIYTGSSRMGISLRRSF